MKRVVLALGLIRLLVGSALAAEPIVGVAHGGTGGHDAASARAGIGAAASGANSDITSLSGLTSLTLSGLPACTPGSAVAPVLAGQAFICNGMILIAQ